MILVFNPGMLGLDSVEIVNSSVLDPARGPATISPPFKVVGTVRSPGAKVILYVVGSTVFGTTSTDQPARRKAR